MSWVKMNKLLAATICAYGLIAIMFFLAAAFITYKSTKPKEPEKRYKVEIAPYTLESAYVVGDTMFYIVKPRK